MVLNQKVIMFEFETYHSSYSLRIDWVEAGVIRLWGKFQVVDGDAVGGLAGWMCSFSGVC